MKLLRFALIATILGLVVACAPTPVYPPPGPGQAPQPPPTMPQPPVYPLPPQEPTEPEPTQEPKTPVAPEAPRTAAEASGAAVMALLGQGNQLAASGHYKRASATIERAINIEPRNPFIFQRLAQLRLQQGQPRQAETLARKSNSLGQDNPYLRADNWALIAQALRAQGLPLAAESAIGRAKLLRGRLR